MKKEWWKWKKRSMQLKRWLIDEIRLKSRYFKKTKRIALTFEERCKQFFLHNVSFLNTFQKRAEHQGRKVWESYRHHCLSNYRLCNISSVQHNKNTERLLSIQSVHLLHKWNVVGFFAFWSLVMMHHKWVIKLVCTVCSRSVVMSMSVRQLSAYGRQDDVIFCFCV